MSEQKKTGLPPITSSIPVGGGGGAARPAAPKPPTPAQQPAKAAEPKAPAPVPAPVSAPGRASEPSQPQQASAPSRPAPVVRKPKQDKPPENDQGIWRMSRKNFLSVAGWFAFFGFLATATLGALRLMVPRVLYEPPSAFKAKFPEEYIVGEVDESYKDDYRVWIVREPDGFYAISAICTHLGCTPRWLASERKFKCPCHGSGFQIDGVNFEGPAPRPLERLKITLADDGRLLIDRKIKFLYEKQEWSKPGAFLRYT